MTRYSSSCDSRHRSAMPHEGRIEQSRERFTWGQIAIMGYCVGITLVAIAYGTGLLPFGSSQQAVSPAPPLSSLSQVSTTEK